jgi:hypothetical protein
MIRKSVSRFSEKIMLNQKPRARWRFDPIPSRSGFADLLGQGRTSPPAGETVQICYGCNMMIGRIPAACLSASIVRLRASRNVGFGRRATAKQQNDEWAQQRCPLHDAGNHRAIERWDRRRPSGYRRLIRPANAMSHRERHHVRGHDQIFTTEHAKEIFSIIQHDATVAGSGSLAIRKLVFRDDPLDLVRADAVSEPSVGLDRHALNDRINLWLLDLDASLRPLTAMKDGLVDLVNMCHFSIPLGSLGYKLTRREVHTTRPQRGL